MGYAALSEGELAALLQLAGLPSRGTKAELVSQLTVRFIGSSSEGGGGIWGAAGGGEGSGEPRCKGVW